MRTAVIIPSLGAPSLMFCLKTLLEMENRPRQIVLVLSGGAETLRIPEGIDVLRFEKRLGFAPAVNRGMEILKEDIEAVALLNDDAIPGSGWPEILTEVLIDTPNCASVQGSVLNGEGSRLDGRGIGFDVFGLPFQLDRGDVWNEEESGRKRIPGVSATAAVYRRKALDAVRLKDGGIMDERFGSYHEDVDLALRLHRLEYSSYWKSGASCRHLASMTGRRMRYRHAWWLLANRWRMLAGNFKPGVLLKMSPRLFRGDLRALRVLLQSNPFAIPAGIAFGFAFPFLIFAGLARRSSGPRLGVFPEPEA